ncbi:MAG TPA: EVE domain-containing protein [Myxococcales bacterium]|nr:EVE domain-containing protein [Myxococcales bacterium]
MAKRRYWLVKSEPDAYSIDDLERDGQAEWDGVRNYQARNFMRDDMTVGDLVLFYHSNAKPPGVAGVAKVATEAYPDPTQFDPKSKYHDPKATEEAPRWHLVDLSFVEKFDAVLGLDVLKEHADDLEGMMVIKRGIRFSVQPVEKEHFRKVLKLAGAKTKVR